MAPRSDELRALLSKGYSPAEIARLTPQQLQQAITQSMGGRTATLPLRSGFRDPFSQQPQNYWQQNVGPNFRDPFSAAASGGQHQRAAAPNNGKGSTLLKTLGIGSETLSGVGDFLDNLPGLAKKIIQKAGNKPRAQGKGRTTATPGAGSRSDSGGTDFQFNDLAPYDAPELTYRDFTDQARGQVQGIYDPRYAAIDAAMRRAQEQYGRSRQVVGGLYENLAKSVAKTAEDTKARYSEAAQNQQAATQQTAADVAQTYTSGQQQEANLLRQLGQEEAAPQVLSDNTADSSYQQGQILREGQNQQNFNTNQGNAQQDYLSNLSDAHQTGGAVAQQDLLNQLAGTNAGYEQDRFNLQGDQAQAALSLAQQLSDRDFGAQQANAQMGFQEYSANNQNNQWGQEQQYRQQQDRVAQQNQAAQMRMALEQMRQGQFNNDRDYALNQAKYTTDLANSQAQLRLEEQKLRPGGYQGLDVGDQDPTSRAMTQITSATNGDTATARQYYDFVQQATNQFASKGLDAAAVIGSQFAFVSEIGRQAEARGLNPIVAQAAASAIWQNMLKEK